MVYTILIIKHKYCFVTVLKMNVLNLRRDLHDESDGEVEDTFSIQKHKII